MKYIESHTEGNIPPYEEKQTVINFVCSQVRRIADYRFKVKGTLIEDNKQFEFLVDRLDTNCYLFAPGYVFTIFFHKKPRHDNIFIIMERVYHTSQDCFNGVDDIKFWGEEEKSLLATPYNTVKYFEASGNQAGKKTYGRQ